MADTSELLRDIDDILTCKLWSPEVERVARALKSRLHAEVDRSAALVNTDGASPDVVLAAVKACAASWVPDARILGNVRAGDIVRALTSTSQAEAQAPAVTQKREREGHKYADHDGTSNCAHGCGAWMGPFRSGAPNGIDPFGECPKAPLLPTPAQAEAQAPTTSALTEDERRLLDDVAGFLASENSLVNSHEHARKIRDLRVRLTVGAPAPAPTMPTPGYPCAKCNRPVNHTLWGTCVECQRIAKGDTP